MTCAQLKDRLTIDPTAGHEASAAAHLQDCAGCRSFADLRLRIHQGMVAHHARVEPDATFAVRVAERLDAPSLAMEWAAARLLPVAFATALVLAFLCVRVSTPVEVTTVASVTDASDDVLLWALESPGGAP